MYWYGYGGYYPSQIPMLFGDDIAAGSLAYWTRSLFQRMTALITIDGAPEPPENRYRWDTHALKYQLFYMGFAPVFRSRTYGVVPQPGTLTGFGLQYQPTGVLINTPYFQFNEALPLGVDCELIQLTPDYTGIIDIVAKYASELREADVSLRSSMRNVRFGYAMAAGSAREARSLRAAREKILNGDDVIIDNDLIRRRPDRKDDLPWMVFNRDIKQSYVVNDVLEARRDILVDFYREIGVRMLDNKKERMITSEVTAAQAETFIRSEVWAETLKGSVRNVNKLFGTHLNIRINKPDVLSGGAEEVSADAGK